jgi:hypothetical protein
MVGRVVVLLLAGACCANAADTWVASWAASPHGPYPSGNAVAQPELKEILPPAGANDQTFRLIVKPDRWAKRMRLRFTNVFGAQPVSLDDVYLGIHAGAGRVLTHTNRAVAFDHGKRAVTIEPVKFVYSDAVALESVDESGKLAVSFHVVGASGPLTWHAKAMTTSYSDRAARRIAWRGRSKRCVSIYYNVMVSAG